MGIDIADLPDSKRPRDRSFFFVALFLVAPVRAVAPLAWAYVAYSLHSGSVWASAWKYRLLFAFAICEVLFSVYHYYLVTLVSVPWKHGTGNLAQLQIAFTRVLKSGLAEYGVDAGDRPGSPSETITQLERDDPRSIDFRNVLRTWFGRVPWSSIRRVEVQKWIYWSIFNKDLSEAHNTPPAHQAVLDDSLKSLEMRLGTRITEGSNPKILPMRMTLDKVQVSARPFFFYAAISGINWYLRRRYSANWNLHYGKYDGLEYLVYLPESWDPATGPRPVVFLHGLGLGHLQYHYIIRDLRLQLHDRPLLIPLQPHASQNIFHPHFLNPVCRQDLADRLLGLMHKLGWVNVLSSDDLSKDAVDAPFIPGVTMLSHSNGSYLHAWCLKRYPELISRSCFVDPVTFCSWEGDTCYNFLYRPPTTGFDLLVRYFIGTELGVANLMRRHFDWSSNALWYEEIPNAQNPSKTLFLLGGKDSIINAERVRKYLTSHGITKNLWYDQNGLHGHALASGGAGHALVMRWLKETEE
ncbi:hypothetical protein GGX14DRAFT_613710 [Mycena pura]|uniref:Alpha/beta-hydrolase n=1 Tax=Mycena pura TaxID=153505 RepID=A0AAD7E5B7_9AGAR|nr:hypothetical protein GGX14DRAFT_613710 [Mycena pura]